MAINADGEVALLFDDGAVAVVQLDLLTADTGQPLRGGMRLLNPLLVIAAPPNGSSLITDHAAQLNARHKIALSRCGFRTRQRS